MRGILGARVGNLWSRGIRGASGGQLRVRGILGARVGNLRSRGAKRSPPHLTTNLRMPVGPTHD